MNATILSTFTSPNSAPYTFENFRPVSLCNLIFYIITKVTALKPIFSEVISFEQFGFSSYNSFFTTHILTDLFLSIVDVVYAGRYLASYRNHESISETLTNLLWSYVLSSIPSYKNRIEELSRTYL